MLMYGSTTFLILLTATALPATPLWLTAGVDPGTWALAAGLATGGSALAWFRDRFAPDLVAAEAAGGPSAFEALAAEAAFEHGDTPIVLPYLSGERTPLNDPFARGVIAGLSLHAGRGDVYRGLVAGIAHAVRANVEAMRALGAPIQRVVAVGGGTADRALVQAVSDTTGLDQALPVSTVGAARGDAFLAGRAAGILEARDLAGWVEVRDVIEHDPGAADRVAAEADRFQRLYADTRALVHELAAGD
jgi:xylulokinase